MLSILITILPVFLVLASGYCAARTGYLGPTVAQALNAYTVKLAVPALLFRAMVQLDFAQAFHGPMLISFYVGAIVSFLAGYALARTIWNKRPGEAVAIAFCALFSNTVLLGIPIAQRAFGDEVLTSVFGIISLHAPCLYIIGMISMELARRDGIPLKSALNKSLQSIFRNSLMIGVIAGVTINFSGATLPEPVMVAVDMLAASAIPAALVGIGASLVKYKLSDDLQPAIMISGLSLLVHPAITFGLAWFVFELDAIHTQAAVTIAAMPPGMNIYIFAVMYNRAQGIAASAILIATATSVTSIAFWLFLLDQLFAGQ